MDFNLANANKWKNRIYAEKISDLCFLLFFGNKENLVNESNPMLERRCLWNLKSLNGLINYPWIQTIKDYFT